MEASVKNNDANYTISLGFENVSLPPFEDILVLTYKSQYGKLGVTGSLNLLQPDKFEVFEVTDHDVVEAILVNKRILKRMRYEDIISVLKQRVFDYVDQGEIVKVDFKVRISYEALEHRSQEA
jgi:hypothetical protein